MLPARSSRLDRQRRVVAPLVRVADLRRELGQLGLRFLLRFRAHPVERVDALLVRRQQVLHQLFHARLALGREMLADVLRGRPLRPARCRRSTRRSSSAAGFRSRRRAWRRRTRSSRRRRPSTGTANRRAAAAIRSRTSRLARSVFSSTCVEAGQVAWLVDDDVVGLAGDAGRGQRALPVVARRQRRQLGEVHLVVALDRVAQFSTLVHCTSASAVSSATIDFAIAGGILFARQRERFSRRAARTWRARRPAWRRPFSGSSRGPAGPGRPGSDLRRVAGRLARVLSHVDRVRHRHADLRQVRHQRRHAFLSRSARMRCISPASGRVAERVELFLVHVAGVQVADFLGVGAGLLVRVLLRRLDDRRAAADSGRRAAWRTCPSSICRPGSRSSCSHLPFRYVKKSSCARTAGFMYCLSMPEIGAAGCGDIGGAGEGGEQAQGQGAQYVLFHSGVLMGQGKRWWRISRGQNVSHGPGQ